MERVPNSNGKHGAGGVHTLMRIVAGRDQVMGLFSGKTSKSDITAYEQHDITNHEQQDLPPGVKNGHDSRKTSAPGTCQGPFRFVQEWMYLLQTFLSHHAEGQTQARRHHGP